MIPHTPGADVAAGDIVVVGATLGVAHCAIKANTPGFLSVGPGVYEVTGNFASLAAGDSAFYTAGTPGTFAATGKHFGTVLAAANANGITRQMLFNQNHTSAA